MKKTLIYLISLVSYLMITTALTLPVHAQKKPMISKQSKANSKLLQFNDGDMIFQPSISPQCKAIQLATRSPYSHCGFIFYEQAKPYVLDAVQPVTLT